MRIHRWISIILAGLCAGCGGGGGTDELAQDAAAAVDTYVVLDLATGKVLPAGSDPATVEADPANRTSRILFRRITAGTGTIGCPGNLSLENERDTQTVAHAEFLYAVFELSQTQWELLAGTTPWTSPQFDGAFTDKRQAIGALLPAWGMSCQQAQEAAEAWSRDGWTVGLPTSNEWEIACRAGTAINLFPWGNLTDAALARNRAVFWDLSIADPLPIAIGSRSANAWGIHDAIGNVWEFALPDATPDAKVELRGGAYDQPLVVCRASNRLALPRDLSTSVAGVRLVLRRTGG